MKKTQSILDSSASNLKGQFLIAMPGMSDPRFDHSVVYLCAHSPAGAMGLIINKPLEDITMSEIIDQLVEEDTLGKIDKQALDQDQQIYRGGPVEQGRGFVLHSNDYEVESTLKVSRETYLTSSVDILKDIALGKGPDRILMALGYAGWSTGQLEAEIGENGWLNCDATKEILFSDRPQSKYDQALALMGIDSALLSSDAGHA